MTRSLVNTIGLAFLTACTSQSDVTQPVTASAKSAISFDLDAPDIFSPLDPENERAGVVTPAFWTGDRYCRRVLVERVDASSAAAGARGTTYQARELIARRASPDIDCQSVPLDEYISLVVAVPWVEDAIDHALRMVQSDEVRIVVEERFGTDLARRIGALDFSALMSIAPEPCRVESERELHACLFVTIADEVDGVRRAKGTLRVHSEKGKVVAVLLQ